MNRNTNSGEQAASTYREKWDRMMATSSDDWHKYRTFAWVFLVVAVVTVAYLVGRPYLGRPSMLEQLCVFLGLGIFFGWFGFLLGFHNADKRLHWSAADVLWVGIALWGLLRTLQPIDGYLNDQERNLERHIVTQAFNVVFRDAGAIEWSLCTGAGVDPKGCESARAARNEMLVVRDAGEFFVVEKALAEVVKYLPQKPDGMLAHWEDYKAEFARAAENERGRAPGKAFLIISYSYIAVLILAFGLRMGRAGSDWRRSRDDLRNAAKNATSSTKQNSDPVDA